MSTGASEKFITITAVLHLMYNLILVSFAESAQGLIVLQFKEGKENNQFCLGEY